MTTDNTLQTTATSLEVLELLSEMDGARVAELAEELQIPPSTGYTHLATLRETGFLVKEGDVYRPSMKLVSLGERVRSRSKAYKLARSKVQRLARQTGLRAHFVVEEGGRGHYLYSGSGEDAVKAFAQAGKKAPLHATAAGKSILSVLPEPQVDEIVEEHGLHAETDNTITDRDELRKALETIRKRGYAFNRQEHLNGVKAVGTPVCGRQDRVVGALSVAGPAYQVTGDLLEAELPQTVLRISNEFELNIAYS